MDVVKVDDGKTTKVYDPRAHLKHNNSHDKPLKVFWKSWNRLDK